MIRDRVEGLGSGVREQKSVGRTFQSPVLSLQPSTFSLDFSTFNLRPSFFYR